MNSYRKVLSYLNVLDEQRRILVENIKNIGILPCGYKVGNDLPAKNSFSPYDTNGTWGNGKDSHAWFYIEVNVPQTDNRSILRVKTDREGWDACNPQFIAYVDGKMRQGLDVNHTEIELDEGKHIIHLYAYVGMAVDRTTLSAELMQIPQLVEKLYYDVKVPFDGLSLFEEYSAEYANTLSRLDDAVSMLDLYKVPSQEFYLSVKKACDYMDKEFYGKYCRKYAGMPTTVCIGHTHIDCAWLWTLEQTREKVQRSFSTVVELMKRYPDYKFMSSQALLYKKLKEEAPDIYDEVRRLVNEGRWECEGGMWVEADCNLVSGESLVRQIIYGKRFFNEEFGVDNRVLWLPDVFGYSAALPQILKKCGIEWFVTSKISWNETNKMPYDTFEWQGIDGTRINSYFLTAQDKEKGKEPPKYCLYVAHTRPSMVAGAYDRYQQKPLSNEVLLTFGHGDGGGGPTEGHLEMEQRLEKGIPGIPATKVEFAGDFLTRLEKKIKNSPKLPVWNGELYLEFHRGTYTSIFKNKKNNRKAEFSYLNTELLATLGKVLLGMPYPKNELHRGWEMILTNQFHDIIPGSSIKEVYDRCDKDYEAINAISQPISNGAYNAIGASIDASCGYVVFNPNSFVGEGIVQIDGKSAYVNNIPPKGYACVRDLKTSNSITVEETRLENKFFRLVFDKNMNLVSIYDKKNKRQVLKKGERGNELRVYADYPDEYDAWEWNDFSLDKYRVIDDVLSVEKVDDGARAGLKITRKYLASSICQTVWLYDDIDKIDFDTEIAWHDKHQMLKVAFPVDINSSRATYEIQYGTVERPTHKNTSWDWTKFETCGHKYADLSEGNYGVSLLNDCKYGHDIHDGVMMLSLLRSPTWPYEDADQGVMRCVYSLYPHKGAFNASRTARLAYDLNNPMTLVKATGDASAIPESFSLVSSSAENVLCEVVKQAEDSNDTVCRFYEISNSKTRAKIKFGIDVKKVTLCDMLEREIKELPVTNNSVSVDLGAFEIITLKVYE